MLLSAAAARPTQDYHRLAESRQRLTPVSEAAMPADGVVLPPSQDPFYTAPTNFAAAAPGAILRVREAPGNLTSVIANSTAAYNILYRTTDSNYNATWSVTTLLIPKTGGKDSLLSYQIPYDSADVDASPSYAMYAGPPADIALALGQGWYVNVPDYEGPLAAFTAGVQSGHATLDSVRAILNSEYGLVSDAKYAMWGYSGGALASEWAAELQVQYAPELEFAGAALGGLTPNVTSVLETVNGKIEAGLIPAGILGISVQNPAARAYIVSQLKTSGPYNATKFLSATNFTLVEEVGAFANEDISNYFINGNESLTNPVSTALTNRDGIMGYHGVPQMPIFAYKAIADEVSPIADTDTLVDRYCGVGANIWYQRNTVGSHTLEAVNGDARAFEFLTAVFDGFYHRTECLIENVTVDVSMSSSS